MNRCTFTGRLARDPELRRTPDGTAVMSTAIAIDDGYKDKKRTFYPTIVLWRHNAEFIANYAQKGDLIEVDAKLSERKWTDRDGNKRTSTEFVVEDVKILAKKRDGSDQAADQGGYPEYGDNDYSGGGFQEIPEEGENEGRLPF